jgi:hypothetical protein
MLQRWHTGNIRLYADTSPCMNPRGGLKRAKPALIVRFGVRQGRLSPVIPEPHRSLAGTWPEPGRRSPSAVTGCLLPNN